MARPHHPGQHHHLLTPTLTLTLTPILTLALALTLALTLTQLSDPNPNPNPNPNLNPSPDPKPNPSPSPNPNPNPNQVLAPAAFAALRQTFCEGGDRGFVHALGQSVPWESGGGGKSGSLFCKTLDDRYLIKQARTPRPRCRHATDVPQT